jgi:hypothetical protein
MGSRIEFLLKALLNGESVTVEPKSRVEKILVNCCNKRGVEGLPETKSRIEFLFKSLLKGESVTVEPQSRIEKILVNCCNKCGVEGLPEPKSRIEVLLNRLADLAGGGVELVTVRVISSMIGEVESHQVPRRMNWYDVIHSEYAPSYESVDGKEPAFTCAGETELVYYGGYTAVYTNEERTEKLTGEMLIQGDMNIYLDS